MSESKPKESVPANRPQVGGPVVPSRRRLLHGGLAAGPVLMTLVSRPVLGAVQCVTPSAFCSGNLSAAGIGVICEGHTAGYWINTPNWPAPYTPDTPFNDVFGPSDPYACLTLQDVLNLPDNGALDQTAHTRRHHNRDHSQGQGLHGRDGQDSGRSDSRGSNPRDPGPVALGSLPPAPHHDLPGLGGSTSGGQTGSSNRGANLSKHRQHKAPDPGPADPGTPDPVSDPLACNNNTVAEPSPSDPGSPTPRGRKHRGLHTGHHLDQTDRLASDIVAALLNAQAGYTPLVTVPTVKGIWREYASKGYFEPTAGVQWSLDEIRTYIASTQPA